MPSHMRHQPTALSAWSPDRAALTSVDRRPAPGHAGERRSLHQLSQIEAAAVRALAYADLFDSPLSAPETHRYLPIPARPDDVERALESLRKKHWVETTEGFYVLGARTELVEIRHRRAETSARLWPRAIRSAHLLSYLPWVRLVAVSGSLAVDAAAGDSDIDLFIVSESGRVWTTRASTIALGRLVAAVTGTRKVSLCPNYVVAVSALHLPERDLFTAHELAQLVPLFGQDAYRALLERNQWYRQFLPNHPGYVGTIADIQGRRARRFVERVLANPLVAGIERWEMRRKVRRLRRLAPDTTEVHFDATICKGHFAEHRARTLRAFDARLRTLEEGQG